MERLSKFLVWFVLILIVLSVSATFYKAVILQDFEIVTIEEEEGDELEEEILEEAEPILDEDLIEDINYEPESIYNELSPETELDI